LNSNKANIDYVGISLLLIKTFLILGWKKLSETIKNANVQYKYHTSISFNSSQQKRLYIKQEKEKVRIDRIKRLNIMKEPIHTQLAIYFNEF